MSGKILVGLAVVLLLATCSCRPVGQLTKEKEKGMPLIISQYSSVRMSKYNTQTAKEAPLPQIIPTKSEDSQVDKTLLDLPQNTAKQTMPMKDAKPAVGTSVHNKEEDSTKKSSSEPVEKEEVPKSAPVVNVQESSPR